MDLDNYTFYFSLLRDHIPKQKDIAKIIVYINVCFENIGWLSAKFITIAVMTYTNRGTNNSFHQAISGFFLKAYIY